MDDNENSESAFVLSESEDECESVIVSSTSCSNTQSQRNSERGGDGDVWAPKSKRKRTDNRRRIRKILSPEQLDAETLSAQKEEQERLRRLELQKSLNVFGGVPAHQTRSTPSLSVSPGDGDTGQNGSAVLVNVLNKISDPVIVIDDSEDESDIQVGTRETEISSSVIEISDSGSDSELDGGEVNDGEPENSGSHTNDDVNQPNADGRVLVNVNHPPTEPDIFLSAYLSKWVKPHQIGGIRFLYDNLVESLSRFDVSPGFGCILAHSMGLGKTLQLICFINIFLTYTKAKKVLCIVPMNTIQNWWSEFNMWLPERSADSTKQSTEDAEGEQIDGEDGSSRLRKFKVFLLSENLRTTVARSALITEWHQKGGVLLMGYEMYRILAMYAPSLVNNSKLTSSKRKKPASSSTEVIDLDEEEKNMELLMDVQKALCRPGPDLVVCDEGHRIKNNQANISQALKKILTRRRVVLTGYPLQNNLLEYWCMVDFVRPNFLGTRHEFSNMFERPITNGQCVDSTASDIKLMRFRAHVLHSLLEGFVQRRSESVLTKTLPEKEEHVIPVGMSSIQISLYKAFVSSVKSYLGYVNPITAFAMCIKIWNHPDILKSYLNSKKEGGRNYSPLTVDDPDLDIGVSVGKKTKETRSEGSSRTTSQGPTLVPPDPKSNMGNNTDWVGKLLDDYESGVLQNGSKMVVLTEIIERAVSLGDKILVFSQSLSTLSMIEDFLRQRVMPPLPSQIMFQPVHWERNKNYYRLDGGTSSQERDKLIRAFNSKSNQSVFVFLMSTRACSLGVNLIGANRVVIFDASWNPCHDAQAVCRVYRYGQTKKCYIYRLVSSGTFEKQMYERQVTKEGVSDRVIDELNPTANLTKHEVMHLFNEPESDTKESIKDAALSVDKFSDPVLNHVCEVAGKLISKLPFKHKTQTSQKSRNVLTKAEKREAKKGYERDKRAINNSTSRYIPVPFSSSMPIREPVRPQAIKRPIGHVRPIQNVQASPSPCVRTPLVSLGAPLRPPIPPLLGNMPSMAYLMSLSCPPLPHARYYQPGELRPFPPFPANHSSTAAGGVMGRVTSRSPIVVNLLTSHEKDDASKPPESNAGMDKPDESDFTDAQSKSSSDVESPDLAISMTPRQSSAPAVLQLVSTVSANRGSQCQSSSSVESDKRLVDFSVSDGIIMTDENASHSQSSDAVEPSKNLVAADSPSENVATPIESSDD